MDSECALSVVAIAVIFTLDLVSPSCFTVDSFLTTLVATGVVGAPSAGCNVMPVRLLFDLGDPGWGDPWFSHGALLLLSPTNLAHWCAFWFSCASCFGSFSNDT